MAAFTASDMAAPIWAISRATSGGPATKLPEVCCVISRNSLFQSVTMLLARAAPMPIDPQTIEAANAKRKRPE